MKRLSCGVLVTDGAHLLLGHATGTPRWDIPKGEAEAGEQPIEAACRELREETGLVVRPEDLVDLGVHQYLPAKDLALFRWRTAMPDPAALCCTSRFRRGAAWLPEFDRFAVLPWPDALARVTRPMAAALAATVAAPP